MRLIDTSNLLLKEFQTSKNPVQYAILSHTWGPSEDEVSFEEMTPDIKSSPVSKKSGFKKIEKTCYLARTKYGLKYAWVDTCCINKTSSAELTEAINSMFRWYQQAAVCFVFLDDLKPETRTFQDCKWFTRGWTLQELIAPQKIVFYDKSWTRRGKKSELSSKISKITGIAKTVLDGMRSPAEFPIAIRMSWAAGRETTREEDLAYSLLGIFDVHMPMLYGEGNKAFIRLQEEIIKDSTDMSIFAWKALPKSLNYTGLLARSPDNFSTAGSLGVQRDALFDVREFSITNRGLKFHVPVIWDKETGYCILPVNHSDTSGTSEEYSLGVFLRRVGPDLFVRALPDRLGPMQFRGTVESLSVVKTLSTRDATEIEECVVNIPKPKDLTHSGFRLSKVEPRGCWDASQELLIAGHTGVFLGYMHFIPKRTDEFESFVLMIGFSTVWKAYRKWQFGLVRGSDWSGIQPGLLRHHSLMHESEWNQKISLPHLHEESKAKFVSLQKQLKVLQLQPFLKVLQVIQICIEDKETMQLSNVLIQ